MNFGRGSTKNQAEKGKGREQGLEEKWNVKKLPKNTWEVHSNSATHH